MNVNNGHEDRHLSFFSWGEVGPAPALAWRAGGD